MIKFCLAEKQARIWQSTDEKNTDGKNMDEREQNVQKIQKQITDEQAHCGRERSESDMDKKNTDEGRAEEKEREPADASLGQSSRTEWEDEDVLELALAAGHILLESGAEIFRVEETMDRICRHYGVCSGNEFVLSNGIFVTAGSDREKFFAKVQHIPVSGTHLDKVAAINQLSREIEEGKYTVDEAFTELRRIQAAPGKRRRTQILASGIGSAAFCCLFGGGVQDTIAALIAGLILYTYILFFSSRHLSKIVANISGGALVTILCGLMYFAGLGSHPNFMVIGSIMPLIPGVPFTNAIREMADGDYISGSVRMLDALMAFFCIAIGVGFGVSVLTYLTGGALL